MPEQTDLVKKLKSFLKIAEKVKKKHEKDWYEIEQFLDGNHYTVYLPRLDKLVAVKETDRGIKRTVNLIRKLTRAMFNVLLANQPNWLIKPRDKSEEAHKEANIASKYLRWFYQQKNLKERLKDLLWFGFARGIGIAQIREKDREIDLDLDLDVFDCYLDPTGRNRFFIKTFKKSIAELEETKDEEGNPVYHNLENLSSSKLAASSVKELLLRERGHEGSTDKDKDLSELLCYEYQIKETSGKVRIITLAGAEDTEIRNDETDLDELPFEFYYPEKKPTGVYAQPWLKDLLPLQRGINRVVSFVENYIFTMLWGRYLKRKGQTINTMLTKHGQIVNYEGGTTPPTQQPLQNLPPIVLDYFSMLRGLFEDFTIHSESMGKKTKAAESGKAIALLQAADVANLSVPRTNLEQFLVRVAKKILKKLSDQLVSTEFRLEGEVYKVIGKEGESMEGVVNIGEFDRIECEITPGSAFSDWQEKEEVLALVKAGVFRPDETPEVILETFKWGAVKDVLDRRKEKEREMPTPGMPAGAVQAGGTPVAGRPKKPTKKRPSII